MAMCFGALFSLVVTSVTSNVESTSPFRSLETSRLSKLPFGPARKCSCLETCDFSIFCQKTLAWQSFFVVATAVPNGMVCLRG